MSSELFLAVAGNAAGAGEATYVEDVFSTYLYEGNGTGKRIQNGIRLGDESSSNSVRFDGDNDNLNIASASTLNLGAGDFTVEGWFYMDSATGGDGDLQTFFSAGHYNTGGILWRYKYFQFGSYATNLSTYTPAGQWNHLAVVRNGSGTSNLKIYVNGTAVASTTSTTSHSSASGIYIGASTHSSTTECLQGNVSNFRMVKGTAVYTSDFTVPTTPLSTIAGTVLLTCQSPQFTKDHSNNPHTVNITGNAAIDSFGFGPFTSDTEGKGGLVWCKARNYGDRHCLFDTERGATKRLSSNLTNAEFADVNSLTSFNSNGFTLGSSALPNRSTYDHVSWTFAKAPKFFDVVTYTGTGSAQNISHNLGSVPGMIIIKETSGTNHWIVGHRSTGFASGKYLILSSTAAAGTTTAVFNSTDPTSSVFTLGNSSTVNNSGDEYVAYLFAHNDGDGGFGENGDQDIIKCGSYSTTNVDKEVDLGFEPQWVLIKKTNSGNNYEGWNIFDNMRGVATGGNDPILLANSSAAEDGDANNPSYNYLDFTSTGFITKGGANQTNGSGGEFIYIAIRRGPMKTPESGTEVFALEYPTDSTANAIQPAGFPVDLVIAKSTTNTSYPPTFGTRMLGGGYLRSDSTAAFASWPYVFFDTNEGYYSSSPGSYFTDADAVQWMFRRAPGFFDVVTYEGTGVAGLTVNHNLGVAPEMMIIKHRGGYDWLVYHQSIGNSNYLRLNAVNGATSTTHFNSTTPTESVFTVGDNAAVNGSGSDYIVYLFATVPGISKVGTYTGNGTGQTIDCGFSAGARFVLIKRTDGNSNWNVYDTERGIVAGNDSRLELDSTDAADTGSDDVDPDPSGFAVTSDAFVNTNGASYAFLAIA